MKAMKIFSKVEENGKIKIPKLPFRKGSRVEIIILERPEKFDDLLLASEEGLAFWDNAIDDRIWNNA